MSTISYRLDVVGPGGRGHCKVTTTVAPKPDNFPSCSIWAEPSSLPYGGNNSTLRWTALNATSATIARLGVVPISGSRALAHFISTISYKLSVTGLGGTANCKTTITVAPKQAYTVVKQPKPAAPALGNNNGQAADSSVTPSGGYMKGGVYYSPYLWAYQG